MFHGKTYYKHNNVIRFASKSPLEGNLVRRVVGGGAGRKVGFNVLRDYLTLQGE